MPQSLSQVIIHLVFSTLDRRPLIGSDEITSIHAYLATLVRDRGGECFRVGGVTDHVHLAILHPRTETIADLVGHIKRSSTRWIRSEKAINEFAWQSGYGAFSVSPPHLDQLIEYIDNQEEHHKHVSFQEEYRTFLQKYGIKFDERYVWD